MSDEGRTKVGDLDAPVPRAPGAIIGEKYRVIRVIARGGTGIVYEAEHTWTERRVALKMLLPKGAAGEAHALRFMQEAKSAAKLAHPGIVEIMDMGRDPADGALFLVQGLLAGEDLRQRIERAGPLALDEIYPVLAPIMEALSAAHEQGVLHRDIKPSNIFLAEVSASTGEIAPKLIDFGASKLLGDGENMLRLTQSGALVGTPSYMSPEQLRDETLDPRSDIWSLGVVMFEALTGRLPFEAHSYAELVARVLTKRARLIARLCPGISPALAAVVHRALEPDRDDRFHDVKAMLESFTAAARVPARARGREASEADDQTLIDDTLRERLLREAMHSLPSFGEAFPDEVTNAIAVSARLRDTSSDPPPGTPPGGVDTLVRPIPREISRARGDAVSPGKDDWARKAGPHPRVVPAVASPPRPARRPGSAASIRRVRMGLVPVPADRQDHETLAAIERSLGGLWKMQRFPSYSTLVDAITEDEIELAWLPPVAYLRARRLGPLHLMLALERAGQPAYGSALIATEASGVKGLPEITGKRVVWVDAWSAAGYLMPRGVLRAAGIDPARAFASQSFVGTHAAVLEALEAGRADLGATYCSLDGRGALVAAPWSDRKGLKPLAFSGAIPGDTICASGEIPIDEAEAMVEPLARFSSSEEGAALLRRLFGAARFASVEPSYYQVLEDVLEDDLRPLL